MPLKYSLLYDKNAVEPRYNEDIGTMKSPRYNRFLVISGCKNKEIYRTGTSKITLLLECFVISDLFITRFHCTRSDPIF